MPSWHPQLPSSGYESLYRRLVDAIASDIEAGRLTPGTRLPPQRELAHLLSISLGAVTRAYDEATRRGLLTAHVGRGTFVADPTPADSAYEGEIDLSINTAPAIQRHSAMVETLAALRRRPDWEARVSYLPPCGLDDDRRAAMAWLERTAGLEGRDWRTLISCSGAQNAMAIAMAATCRPGDSVLCEALTFSGARSLADMQDYHLHGVEMDDEGVNPAALDRAAARSGARVFYTLPTLHNPTGRTASLARRQEIVKVARTRNLLIIEDDVYALYARNLVLPPLATLAPERAFYISSMSKLVSPGLRQGFLVTPGGEFFDRCINAARAFMHSPSGISGAVATEWFQSGRADDMVRGVCEEMAARTQMALAAIGGMVETQPAKQTLHLWLGMEPDEAERICGRALRGGLRLAAPDAFLVPMTNGQTGLRLCIGAASNRATLARALDILTTASSRASMGLHSTTL